VECLIIDEISFTSAAMLGAYSEYIAVKKGCDDKWFGGMDVCASGDLFQLPPCRSQMPIFDLTFDFHTYHQAPTDAQRRGIRIWLNLTHCVILSKNYRAKDDQDYASFLANLRDNNTISHAHIKRLQSRQLPCGKNAKTASTNAPLDATWAFYSNADVIATNMHMVHRDAAHQKKDIYRLTAEIKPTPASPAESIPNDPALSSLLVGHTQKNSSKLEKNKHPMSHFDIFQGAKIMFAEGNQGNNDGIANGSEGFFLDSVPPITSLASSNTVEVQLPNGEKRRVRTLTCLPQYLLVYVPDATVVYEGLPQGVVPIPSHKTMMLLPHRGPDKQGVVQFRVRHCYAHTVHKLQGLEAASGLVVGAFCKTELNHIYVALSRVRSWEKLFILPYLRLTQKTLTFQPREGNFTRFKALAAEMKRLTAIAKETEANFLVATKVK
jgi:hypothetical protein